MRTLVLNQNYFPIGTISWERAITLFFKGKCEIVEEYDREIRTTSIKIKMPAVVKLLEYVKLVSRFVRFNKDYVYMRDRGRCQYCNQFMPKKSVTFDHVYPKSRGGKSTWTNIVLACYSCNHKKSDRTPTEAGMKLLNQPVMPKEIPIQLVFGTVYKDNLPDKWANWIIKVELTK